jgi:hypothetical protein
MSLAVLQPAASGAAQLHYEDTIKRPVDFTSHSSELGPELVAQLSELHPSGEAPMWGASHGSPHLLPECFSLFSGDCATGSVNR